MFFVPRRSAMQDALLGVRHRKPPPLSVLPPPGVPPCTMTYQNPGAFGFWNTFPISPGPCTP